MIRVRLPRVIAHALTLIGVLLLPTGCAHVPQQTGAMEAAHVGKNADALHVQVIELGRQVCGSIEAAADEIIARSNDPQITRDAVVWKVYAIPLAQEAALRTDPLFAEGDLWGFTIQQRQFFETGAGHDAFGPHHEIALATARRIEHDVQAFAAQSFPGDSLRRHTIDRMHEIALQEPFQSLRFTRVSVEASYNDLLGLGTSGLGATVSDMNRTVAGMYARLGYMNESMMKQVRWNTQLMMSDALANPTMTPTLTATNAALDRFATLAEATPSMVDSLRDAVFVDMRGERIAMIQAMSAERIAIMQGLVEQRIAVMNAVHDERIATLAAAENITTRAIERSEREGERLMWLGGLIAGGLGVGAWILVLAARRMWHTAGGPAASRMN